ncbi:MAG: DNA primase [Lachnospiraceae bacterium]
MYYPDELIEEIRSRNDIVDVISGYLSLKKKGNSYFGNCPFHNEKTPSFSVSRTKQMYYCFGCGAGGNVITFIMEYENYSFQEAVKLLADRAGISLPDISMSQEEKAKADYRVRLKQMNKDAATYFYSLLKSKRGQKGYDYFHSRGISDETILSFGLGYSDIYRDDLYQYLRKKGYQDSELKDSGLVYLNEKGASDKFWNRVMFPIQDVNGKVIGFGGRVLGDGEPKYLNSPETEVFDKSRNLYALHKARTSRKHHLIVCEGYMDVISMHQAGFDQAVASLGTALTSQHAMLLKRYTDEVYLAYDSDQAGVKAALRAIPLLKDVGLSVRVIDMTPYKDPDEFMKHLGKEAFEERIREAQSGFMYEVQVMANDYDLQDPESKTSFYHALAQKLASIPEKLERDNYLSAVARRYMIQQQDFENMVNDYGNRQGTVQSKKTSYENRPKTAEQKQQPQGILLTWLVNEPDLFRVLEGYINKDDFFEPVYHEVAQMLFSQYQQNGRLEPAQVMNRFTDLEQQKLIAGMLNSELPIRPSPENRAKAFTDIVKKVKLAAIEHQMNQTQDPVQWQELMKQKSAAMKWYISI